MKNIKIENGLYKILVLSIFVLAVNACKKTTTENTINQNKKITSELQRVYINGDSLHYLDVGQGEPVVFVHGGLGDYRTWAGQMDTFSTNYRVIAYSRRYAYPNKQVYVDTADYSVKPHAQDLAELIKTLNLGPVHLVGHSWGAFTSLKATIDNPELIKTLVLGEPPAHSLISNTKVGDSLINYIIENAFIPSDNAFQNNDDVEGITAFIGGVMGDSLIYSKVSDATRQRWLQNTTEMRGCVKPEAIITIPHEDVSGIEIPVLVIKGDRSPLYFRKIADTVHSLLPNSRLHTLTKSSHGLQGNNPDEFNKTVLEFINEN